MHITLDTALLILDFERSDYDISLKELSDRWLASGRIVVAKNARSGNTFQCEPSVRQRLFLVDSYTECLFGLSQVTEIFTRNAVRRILFVGCDGERSIETNIRVASSYGFYCYLSEPLLGILKNDRNTIERWKNYAEFVGFDIIEREIKG